MLTLTSLGLQAKLEERWVPPESIAIADGLYVPPTVDWIYNDFAPAAQKWLERMVGDYSAQVSDCDDFADVCAVFARICHRKTLDKPRATALAFGEFWYRMDEGGGHAINCFFSIEKARWELFFFEPQECRIVKLSQQEINSCDRCRF